MKTARAILILSAVMLAMLVYVSGCARLPAMLNPAGDAISGAGAATDNIEHLLKTKPVNVDYINWQVLKLKESLGKARLASEQQVRDTRVATEATEAAQRHTAEVQHSKPMRLGLFLIWSLRLIALGIVLKILSWLPPFTTLWGGIIGRVMAIAATIVLGIATLGITVIQEFLTEFYHRKVRPCPPTEGQP
jgi:hypothetical protein